MNFGHLENEWHPALNLPLTFTLSLKVKVKYWWLGLCGHEWEASLDSRVRAGTGCPVCSNKIILAGFNDLVTTNPSLAAEWHPTKNGELTPETIGAGSAKKVWWFRKSCNHEWDSTINSRNKGTGCPVCVNQKVLAGFNDLATTNPSLAVEWHPTKNGELTPQQITDGANRKVWWQCQNKHEWEITVNGREKGKRGCPLCANQKVLAGFNDLASKYPSLAVEWHPTKNGELTPQQIVFGSSAKVWWQCVLKHEWESTPSTRTLRGDGCPTCGGQTLLTGFNDLATKYPHIAAEWHPTKNRLNAGQMLGGSNKKVWWLGSCGHEWESTITRRTARGDQCVICAGKKVLIGFNDFASRYPHLVAEWHPVSNGSLTPQQITHGSGKRIWWLGACGHEWDALVINRIKGGNCLVCEGDRLLVGFNDLASKYPSLVLQWHPYKNGELNAHQVIYSSTKKVWWQCDKGHEWEISPNSRTIKNHGCPRCWANSFISKSEQKIYDYICSLDMKMKVIQSDRTLLDKNKELDIYLPEKNLAFEYNGVHWHKEKFSGRNIHYDKWLECKDKGVKLVQIWEDDWNLRAKTILSAITQIINPVEVGIEEFVIVPITQQQTENFLNETHLQGFVTGLYYLGLFSGTNPESLQAVLVLDKESETAEEKTLNITRYAAKTNFSHYFTELLFYVIDIYNPESLVAVSDHCTSDDSFYESKNFIAEKEIAPDYMYVIKAERKDKSEYPLERFRDDPKLLWEEGLTEMELADLNSLDRIWDAGKTRYRLSL